MIGRWFVIPLILTAAIEAVFLFDRGQGFAFNLDNALAPAAEEEEVKQFEDPPAVVKAVYATSWSAATPSKLEHLINLIDETELNAIVIDIKDFSGHVAYDTDIKEVEDYGAEEIRIADTNSLIKELHDHNIYVIGRVTVFQDPILAEARPGLAVKDSRTGKAWLDHKGLAWVDPASYEVWDYNIAIAEDALARGFDEINFDYIRFPSDGNLEVMSYPVYNANLFQKQEIIRDFFTYLRDEIEGERISADLFGQTTFQADDMGIGQMIEDAYLHFDYVSPMVYPSHYVYGFLGYQNPALYPYEVITYSLSEATKRRNELALSNPDLKLAELRPWLQDFDLGADYSSAMIREEMRAVRDATGESFVGWMLWDSSNVYTAAALNP